MCRAGAEGGRRCPGNGGLRRAQQRAAHRALLAAQDYLGAQEREDETRIGVVAQADLDHAYAKGNGARTVTSKEWLRQNARVPVALGYPMNPVIEGTVSSYTAKDIKSARKAFRKLATDERLHLVLDTGRRIRDEANRRADINWTTPYPGDLQKLTAIQLDIIKEVRGLGGSLDFRINPAGSTSGLSAEEVRERAECVADDLRHAQTLYPSDWIKESNKKGRRALRGKVPRIDLEGRRSDSGQASYHPHTGGLWLDPNPIITGDDSDTTQRAARERNAVHELAHRMEHTNENLTELRDAFFNQRATQYRHETVALQGVILNRGFTAPYAGRIHAATDETPERRGYEVFAVGAEGVLTGGYGGFTGLNNSPVARDDEYRAFLLGALALA